MRSQYLLHSVFAIALVAVVGGVVGLNIWPAAICTLDSDSACNGQSMPGQATCNGDWQHTMSPTCQINDPNHPGQLIQAPCNGCNGDERGYICIAYNSDYAVVNQPSCDTNDGSLSCGNQQAGTCSRSDLGGGEYICVCIMGGAEGNECTFATCTPH